MWQVRSYTICLSLLLAHMLHITPMPIGFDASRPDWVLLVLVYWSLALPSRVSVGVAFFNGLVLDVLLGTPLGVHSLALSAAVYIAAANYQRLRNYSVWQQAIIFSLLDSFYHLLIFWVLRLLTDINFSFGLMWPVLTSTLLWPWVFSLLRKLRRQLRVV